MGKVQRVNGKYSHGPFEPNKVHILNEVVHLKHDTHSFIYIVLKSVTESRVSVAVMWASFIINLAGSYVNSSYSVLSHQLRWSYRP